MEKWKRAVENLVKFWRGKQVFITGHTGFKGSWLALWLQHLNANVTGFALEPPTQINLFSAADVAQNMRDIRGDVRNYDALNHALSEVQPEIIFHLAAQPLVRESYQSPVETYATNVMGTVHLLEAARHCQNVKAIVNVTTDKCYENREWHWGYRENEPLGGFDPYSNSKGCSELVTSAYRQSFFKKGLASARAGNVIGGGDWATDRLIPDLISASIHKKKLSIRYPQAIRPWQHVLEPLSGYLKLAENLYNQPERFSEAWNFGPFDSDSKTVGWIADEVCNLLKEKIVWEHETAQLHEAGFLKLDCSKAHQKLAWYPKWNIHQALSATVQWYEAFYRNENAKEITLKQIEAYAQ